MKKVYLVDYTVCTPTSCNTLCIQKCPMNPRVSKMKNLPKGTPPLKEAPIRLKKSTNQIIIKSALCIKCGICVNVCPAKAIFVKNLLDEPDDRSPTHQYLYEDLTQSNTSNKETGVLYTYGQPKDTSFSSYIAETTINFAPDGEIDENIDDWEIEEDPEDVKKDVEKGFRLHGLPTLMPGRVTGLCGPNGIGKSTVLNILSGFLKPNFGHTKWDPTYTEWPELVKNIKENEMRDHFHDLYQGQRKIAYKHQVLRVLFDQYKGQSVLQILKANQSVDQNFFDRILVDLDIHAIRDRLLEQCSGGELQRFAIALVLIQKADVYMVDEPCTFLDVKKRIKLAELLQARAQGFGSKTLYPVLVVEHDLAILDYMSDVVHLFFGRPHRFGVITKSQTTKTGINAYLDGYLKAENIEFRHNQIGFRRSIGNRVWENAPVFTKFGHISKTYDTFRLDIAPGVIYESEILGIVGENGCGKSTFAKMLAGEIQPDPESEFTFSSMAVSYKPQYISKDHEGTVKEYCMNVSENYDFSPEFIQLLYAPLSVDKMFHKPVKELSGGELQRVYICACLAKRANLYVIDEPSAYLDVEERLHISGVIRTVTKHWGATTIVIEHDIQICDALADRLMVFNGDPGKHGTTIGPLNKRDGMNAFLKILDITFRRDEDTGRARINKKGSSLDREQRASNEYFYSG